MTDVRSQNVIDARATSTPHAPQRNNFTIGAAETWIISEIAGRITSQTTRARFRLWARQHDAEDEERDRSLTRQIADRDQDIAALEQRIAVLEVLLRDVLGAVEDRAAAIRAALTQEET